MSPVVTIPTKNGPVTAFVCGRGRSRPCTSCNRESTKLCDFKIAKGKTCNAPICDSCATSVGPDLDYCRQHKNAPPPPQGNLFKERCADCDECARHAYSDATTPGFFFDRCEKHRKEAR